MAENVSLDDIKRWKVPELRDFLKKRKLKSSGRKDELCALVYAAHLENKPVVAQSAEDVSKTKAADYQRLLTIGKDTIPDPFFDLKDGWLHEKDGIVNWPPTMQVDIATYILTHVEDRDLSKRLLSDYKEGKAYSYFDSAWLKEVLYNPISQESKVCVLKAESTPSERISNIRHKIWVAIDKKTGVIQSAYCTCFAGLGSTCNHVAAVLFKIDHAWQMGWTNKACTSRPCEWNQYGAKAKVVEPTQICKMEWRKPHYRKKGQTSVINPPERQLFKPVKKEVDSESRKAELVNVLYSSCPLACAFQYISFDEEINYQPCDDVNVGNEVEVSSISIPPTLPVFASKIPDVKSLLQMLPVFSTDDQAAIEDATKQQSNCPEWKEQRVGRITASIAHSVMTKVRTLKMLNTKRSTDTSSLVGRIMMTSEPNENIPALKYGRMMEKEALNAYRCRLVADGHKNLLVKSSGLFVHKTKTYIAASPDGLVSCDCCGNGLVEIKCLYTLADKNPKDVVLPFINKSSEEVNQNHSYYSQMITQMGVTERMWCDLFIFTKQGHRMIRVQFDQNRWTELMTSSEYFFTNFIAPELVKSQSTLHVSPSTPCPVNLPYNESNGDMSAEGEPSIRNDSTNNYQRLESSCNLRRPVKRAKVTIMPLYCCAMCGKLCKQQMDIVVDDENSVQCDKCNSWYHWECVNFEDDDNDDNWYCPKCSMEVD